MSDPQGNTDAPVGLAAVGLGWWGGELARGAVRAGARVVSCFARNPDARAAFADEHGCRAADSYADVLADDEVDGVMLATPHLLHLPMIREAAEAGKHVFVEKPLTLAVDDARAAIAAAEDAGVVLQVGHHRRRLAATRALREHIDAGTFGLLHLLETRFLIPADLVPRTGWRASRDESPLGGMTGLGVHMIDTLHYLAGRIATVACASRQVLARGTLDDVTTLMFELESGPLATLTMSVILPKSVTIGVYGHEGSGWSEDDGETLYLQAQGTAHREQQPITSVDAVADQLAEFARCVRTGAAPEVGGPEALEVVAVLEAARIAERERRTVDVADVRDGALTYG